jgi:copper transport protein
MPAFFRSALIALWLICATVTAAVAHAEFRGSDPAPDTILTTLPKGVTLEFSEDVGVLALAWLLPDGAEAEAIAEARSGMLHITPPPEAGKGSYTLTWRVASADGHPIGGALVFSLGHPSGQRPIAGGDAAAWLAVALRAMMVTALVLCVGAAVYGALVGPIPRDAARLLRRAGFAVPVTGLALVGLEGADRLGGLSYLFTWQGWLSGLTSPAAQAVLLSVLAVALMAPRSTHRQTLRAYLGWTIAAASFAVAGHARVEPWPLMPLTAIHAAAALFWVGGLAPLAAAVRSAHGADRAIPLRRFSKPALPLVVLLIASGGALILHRAQAPDLLGTPWSTLIAVKLTLVTAMIALAVLHRFGTTDRLASGRNATPGVSLRAEALLGLLVLTLAMGFRLAPPPAAVPAHLPMTHFQQGSLMVMLEPSTIPPGLVSFTLHVTDGSRRDFVPKEVTLSLSDATAGIGPIKVQAAIDGKKWITPKLTLPTEGPWQATVTVLVSDFEAVRMEGGLRRPE